MGPVHVLGVVKSVREVTEKDLRSENERRAKEGWKEIKPHRLVGVLVEEGERCDVLRVELMNGKAVERGQKADFACEVYARGNRPVLVCYE